MTTWRKNNSGFFSGSPGFTLLEVIIAITILAFMALGVTKMLQSGLERKDTMTVDDRDRLQVENFWQRLNLDIGQNYTPLYYDVAATPDPNSLDAQTLEAFPAMSREGYVVPVPLEKDDGYIFFTAANRRRQEGQKQSNYAWVRYEIMNLDDGTSALVRRYLPGKVFLGVFEWDKIKPQVILKRAKKLQFFFWHPQKEKFMEHLRDLPSPVVLRAVKVELTWEDLSGQEQTFTRIIRVVWPYFNPQGEAATPMANQQADQGLE